MLLAILAILLTLLVFYVNANQGRNIQNQPSSPITPPGWIFSIWSIIYLFVIYILLQGLLHPSFWTGQRFFYYTFSCLFNIAWIVLFVQQQNARLANFALLGLSISLFFFLQDVIRKPLPTLSPIWFQWIPLGIALYFGWTIMANLLNLSINLQSKWFDDYAPTLIAFLAVLLWFSSTNTIQKKWTWTFLLSVAWGYMGVLIR